MKLLLKVERKAVIMHGTVEEVLQQMLENGTGQPECHII